MGINKVLTSSEAISDLLNDFEKLVPNVEVAMLELLITCDLIKREQGYDFPNIKSRLQEVIVRQMLRELTNERTDTSWDVIEEGESQKFSFLYYSGCLLVDKKYKIPYAKHSFYRKFTEIDFHGIVGDVPIVGEVKGGAYGTSKRALDSVSILRKVYAVSDVFHMPVAYVAVIPKDQIKKSKKRIRPINEQERFLGRGGHLTAFPYDKKAWEEIVYETTKSYSIEIDPNTLPEKMRRRKKRTLRREFRFA